MNEENLIVNCARCGTKNRIPKSRMGDRAVCGKCRTPLGLGEQTLNHPVEITDRTFAEEVLNFPGVVLVDCWAAWCGPCRTLSPVIDQLAREYTGRVKVAKLNVDNNPATASGYSVQSIPTLLFFKAGKPVNRLVGALPKGQIEQHLRSLF